MASERLSTELARSLRSAGLSWHPESGDAFLVDSAELDGSVLTVGDITPGSHELDGGMILAFNGTTQWALDSAALEHAVWLPRESQLRELLGEAFRSLARGDGQYRVKIHLESGAQHFAADTAADAYGLALLDRLAAARPR